MGQLESAYTALRNTIATSTNFRTWVGATGDDIAAQALARVYERVLTPLPLDAREYTRAELETLRPYAIVRSVDFTSESIASGTWGHGGEFEVYFEETIPEVYRNDMVAAADSMMETMDAIATDIRTNANSGSNLAITSVDVADPETVPKEEVEGYGWACNCVMTVSWSDFQ